MSQETNLSSSNSASDLRRTLGKAAGAQVSDGGEHEAEKVYTKKEIEAFVSEIGRRVVDSNAAYMHSLLAINHILRQPNLPELMDAELKEQLKDIWVKLMKSTGLQLVDPPVLFGIPDNAIVYDENAEAAEDRHSTSAVSTK